jgi:two-component system cell cycle response regulator
MAGRILITGHNVEARDAISGMVGSAQYDVLVAEPDARLPAVAIGYGPDIVIVAGSSELDRAIEVCCRLKSAPDLRYVPVIVAAEAGHTAARRAALEAGADELLPLPADEIVLTARLRSIQRLSETSEELRRRRNTAGDFGFAESAPAFRPPGRVAFVAFGEVSCADWKPRLGGLLRHRIEVLAPGQALDQEAGKRVPDVFVLDLATDGTRALKLIPELRSRAATRRAGILVIVGVAAGDTEYAAMALDLGANDLIPADFDDAELAIRLRTQVRRKQEADSLRAALDEDLRMAVVDPLTGLYNRRYAMAHLKRLTARAAETGRNFTIMVADLDHFKAVNDTWGHAGGDAVLIEIARRIKDNLRGNDMVARIGGEEFLIALPDCPLSQARQAGERIRHIVGREPVILPSGEAVPVTMSIGVAVGGSARGIDVVSSLIDDADRALYDAKAEGRNQVTLGRSAA